MECEAWLLFAAPDPTPFPWGLVLGGLFTFLGVAWGATMTAFGIYIQSKNNRLAEQVKALTAEKTEELKAGTTKGQQVVDLQKQSDGHDENLIKIAYERVKDLEGAITKLAEKCETEKEALRNECRDCWKARGLDRDELIALKTKWDLTEKKVVKSSDDRHKAEEELRERIAVNAAKIDDVKTPIEANVKLDIQQIPPEVK